MPDPTPLDKLRELSGRARSLSLTQLPLDLRPTLGECADVLDALVSPEGVERFARAYDARIGVSWERIDNPAYPTSSRDGFLAGRCAAVAGALNALLETPDER